MAAVVVHQPDRPLRDSGDMVELDLKMSITTSILAVGEHYIIMKATYAKTRVI